MKTARFWPFRVAALRRIYSGVVLMLVTTGKNLFPVACLRPYDVCYITAQVSCSAVTERPRDALCPSV